MNLNLSHFYRDNVSSKEKYNWHLVYKYSNLLISSDTDIRDKVDEYLAEIYRKLESVTETDSVFLESLKPISPKPFYSEEIKKMCMLSAEFNVGPMAAVAGLVNEYLADNLSGDCKNLIIENGGDLYLKSYKDLSIGVFVNLPFFKDKLYLKISASDMPCGLCSSSGTFGHSKSLGKCDLAVVMSDSCISADAAATAVANSVKAVDDVEKSIRYFSRFKSIKGLMIIKEKKVGIWGSLELDK